MRSLQTVAMGLVIVFLDVGSDGWDWVADPVGWILVLVGLAPLKERLRGYAALVVVAWACLAVSVLTLPPDSIDSIMPTLGWLFSLPTIAFAALLCGSLAAATDGSRSVWFRSLGGFFVIVAVLPAVVYLVGLDWLKVPAAVAAVLANVALVISTWGAGAGTTSSRRASAPSVVRPSRPVILAATRAAAARSATKASTPRRSRSGCVASASSGPNGASDLRRDEAAPGRPGGGFFSVGAFGASLRRVRR